MRCPAWLPCVIAGTYRVTTAAVDNLQFKEARLRGRDPCVLIGYVTCVGNTSMEVEIDSYVERGQMECATLVNRAFFCDGSCG